MTTQSFVVEFTRRDSIPYGWEFYAMKRTWDEAEKERRICAAYTGIAKHTRIKRVTVQSIEEVVDGIVGN